MCVRSSAQKLLRYEPQMVLVGVPRQGLSTDQHNEAGFCRCTSARVIPGAFC